jgi:hypothetical protein
MHRPPPPLYRPQLQPPVEPQQASPEPQQASPEPQQASSEPQQASPELVEVPLTKEEKKKQAITKIIPTVRKLMRDLRTLDSEKTNPILLTNYDARNKGLTISYPFFDLNDENIISDVTSIVILFHKGLEVNTYRDIIIDGTEDDAVNTLYTISTKFGVRLLDKMNNSELVAKVETMSTTIYERLTDSNTKDIDDFNSPKKEERLQVANDGTSLMFYLNPQGSSRQTFAPTGHGGRNGFIQFTGPDGILYLCANIADRGRDGKSFIIFNAFGGSPDFNEEPSITVFREMIEEMFEKLYRRRRVISDKELADIANGYRLLTEILGSDVTSFDKLREYLGSIHNYDSVLSKKLQPISLINSEHGLIWNGMGFPNHTLPDGTQVLSLTTYNLTNVTTALSPENIIKLLSLTYANQELKGSFIIKTTPTYINFFRQLNNLLLHPKSQELSSLSEGMDSIISEIGPIDFLLISFEGYVYTNGFRIHYNLNPDDNIYMLIISIRFANHQSVDKIEEIALFKIAIDKKTMRVVSKNVPKNGTNFYTNGGGELFFVEKFRLRTQIGDQTDMVTEEISGGRKRTKRTKRTKRMKTKRNKTYKKRRYRRYGK